MLYHKLNFKIQNFEDFWSWTQTKLSVGLRANIWYNDGQPYGLAGYINDFSSRMVGYATLRQLRVKNGNNLKLLTLISFN
jgi:hypothetical protein